MNHRENLIVFASMSFAVIGSITHAQNQTEALSSMIHGEAPFQITIEQVTWGGGAVRECALGCSREGRCQGDCGRWHVCRHA